MCLSDARLTIVWLAGAGCSQQSEFRQSRPPQRREPNGQEAPQRRDPRGQEAPQNGAGPSTGQRPGRVEYVPVRETGDDRAGRG